MGACLIPMSPRRERWSKSVLNGSEGLSHVDCEIPRVFV